MSDVHRLAGTKARVWTTQDLGSLSKAARAIQSEGPEVVALTGGDGSFMAGLTALVHAYDGRPLPTLALVNAGTTGTVSKNFGMREPARRALRRVLDKPISLATERPTLCVRDAEGTTRFGFTFGTGLVAKFFERYYDAGAGGIPTAARIVARIFAGSFAGDTYARSVLDPLPCTLSVAGKALPHRAYSLVVASVLRDLGLHMHVTYRAGEDAHRPHLVASALSATKLGPQGPRVLMGRGIKGKETFDDLVDTFEVRFPQKGPYVLDGDMLSSSSVTVSAGPLVRVVD